MGMGPRPTANLLILSIPFDIDVCSSPKLYFHRPFLLNF